MKIKNYTPHPLQIVRADGETETFLASGIVPRLEVKRTKVGEMMGFEFFRSSLGSPCGLPEEEENTVVVVSALVMEHPSLAGRSDLASPGELIRDGEGKIIGAKGFNVSFGLRCKMEGTE